MKKHRMKNAGNLSKNAMANILTRIWSMIAIYLFIPIYIKFLGEEVYGLVTFFATLQTSMNILGLGLSTTLRREFASGEDTSDNRLYKYKIMRTVEFVYVCIAILIVCICCFSAEFIAVHWLNIGEIKPYVVEFTIKLMGASIGIQMITSLYSGCLFGLEYQLIANIYQVIWSLCKNCGVVLILWLVLVDIRCFYFWHIICDVIYLIILRKTIINKLKCDMVLKWNMSDFKYISKIWKFTCGILLVSFVYVLNTQIDKVIISKYLSLTELGAYNIAYSLGNLTSIFVSGISMAAFSRFTNYYTTNQIKKQKAIFLYLNKLSVISVVVLGSFISVYSYEIIAIWTGSETISQLARGTATYLVLGSTFLSLQQLPYQFLLSSGNTKINNILSLTCIPFAIILTPTLIINYGIMGAGLSWGIYMPLTTIIYLWYIHHKYIGDMSFLWVMRETLLPFLFAFLIANLTYHILIGRSILITLMYGVLFGGITLLVTYFIFDYNTVQRIINKEGRIL